MAKLGSEDREDLHLIVEGDGIKRPLPARFILTGSADDLRYLAWVISSSVDDTDHYSEINVLVSLPRLVERANTVIGWNERLNK